MALIAPDVEVGGTLNTEKHAAECKAPGGEVQWLHASSSCFASALCFHIHLYIKHLLQRCSRVLHFYRLAGYVRVAPAYNVP